MLGNTSAWCVFVNMGISDAKRLAHFGDGRPFGTLSVGPSVAEEAVLAPEDLLLEPPSRLFSAATPRGAGPTAMGTMCAMDAGTNSGVGESLRTGVVPKAPDTLLTTWGEEARDGVSGTISLPMSAATAFCITCESKH
jgi:hypothetical protein